MFHTYVTASSGRQVDVDRAWYLMNKSLLNEAWKSCRTIQNDGADGWQKETKRLGLSKPARFLFHRKAHGRSANEVAWAIYCILHEEKYGEPFEPDHSLSWDS